MATSVSPARLARSSAPASVADRGLSSLGNTVGVFAPTGRDARVAVGVLERWGIAGHEYTDAKELCEAIGRGVAAIILAEEALNPAAREQLVRALETQPSWSDVPIIVLTAEGELSRVITNSVEAVAKRANVVLLERPVRVSTLVTALRSALRARRRQFEIRDHLAEREKLLASERRARNEAEQASRAKSDFLAIMSHELRTPLNAIGGYADLIELGVHGPVTDDQRDALARIKRSEQHLLGLINEVLNYARVETGTVNYDIGPISVRDLVSTTQTLTAPQAQAQSLTLTVRRPDAALHASADRDKTQQILLNLVSNAIKFTPPGGSITIRTRSSLQTVAIIVADTGGGIPADKLERIFEPFTQVDSRLTRTGQGVGLGLAISRDLANGMGGTLSVESVVSEGSRFTLSLPRFT
jgi:signal transduction histidine kinase